MSTRHNEKYPGDALVATIQTFIDDNLRSDLSLETLARRHAVSASSLAHGFKKITGEPVGSYVRRKRMNLAMLLLMRTNMSVKEIAGATHFGGGRYLARAVKRAFGVAPSDLRKKARLGHYGAVDGTCTYDP